MGRAFVRELSRYHDQPLVGLPLNLERAVAIV